MTDKGSGALSKLSNVDEYGFERRADFDYDSYEEFMSDYLSVLTRRARKWSELLGNKDTVGRGIKVKRYIRKGIPMKNRGKMWLAVSGAGEQQKSQPSLYKHLLQSELDEQIVDSIKTDIPRTFPDNIYFRNSKEGRLDSLYNVLVAFAHHNTEVGYCQGLNYIAGLLLIVVKDEELTFWLLVTLVDKLLPGYYIPSMTGVLTDIKVLEAIIKERCPLVWRHLKHEGVDWCLITTKWFICLFVDVLPIETVLRVWDCMFYEGNKILMRVAVSLVVNNEQDLLMAQDFGSLVECFKKITQNTYTIECHTFMESIFSTTGSFPRAHLAKLRETSLAEVLVQQKELEEKRCARSS